MRNTRLAPTSSTLISAVWAISLGVTLCAGPVWAQDEPAPLAEEDAPVEDAPPKKTDAKPKPDAAVAPNEEATPEADAAPQGRHGLTEQQEDALFDPYESVESGPASSAESSRQERALEKPIKEMNQRELLDSGFVFGDSEDSRVRSTATLLALSAGMLGHGVGHWYMGDWRSALLLGAMELSGLTLFLSAGVAPMLYGAEFGASSASRHVMLLGGGLFGASYILDVIGTVQGADPLLFNHPSDNARSASVALKYGYLELGELPVRNVLRADAQLNGGWIYLNADTLQDVGLTISSYGATLGFRPWRLDGVPGTRVEIEGSGDYLQWRQRGRFERLSVWGMAGASLDLGLLSKTLQRVVLGLKAGYLYQWYILPAATRYDQLGAEPAPEQWSQGVGGLPFQMWVSFDLSRRTRVRFDYQRLDGALLHDNSPVFGVPGMQLNYRSTANLDIEVRAEYGSGVGLWGGLRIWASPKDEGSAVESYEDTFEEAD